MSSLESSGNLKEQFCEDLGKIIPDKGNELVQMIHIVAAHHMQHNGCICHTGTKYWWMFLFLLIFLFLYLFFGGGESDT